MSDHIENKEAKGNCVMVGIIGVLLFVILLIYIYQYNGNFLG